ncbi:MAG TPA: hypothetical protein VF423_14925 [Actinomycetes bacterium]
MAGPGVDDPGTDPWALVRAELEADVRRVSDRLRSLSATRLASPPAPPEQYWPPYESRAQAGRAAAFELARAAGALEAAAAGPLGREPRELPVLSDFAVGDQVAVTGHDLLAAMGLVPPDMTVWTGAIEHGPAAQAVSDAAKVLADVRRRL